MIRVSQSAPQVPRVEKIFAYLGSDENSAVRMDVDKTLDKVQQSTASAGQGTTNSPTVLLSAEDVGDSRGKEYGSADMEMLQRSSPRNSIERLRRRRHAGGCQG